MKSNIFATDEPTSTRHVSDKNKSNIFGIGDDPNQRSSGIRQGLRGMYTSINHPMAGKDLFSWDVKILVHFI